MPYIHCLAPISKPNARVLILGSIPGKASLLAQQYYAHPQNLFWPFISEIIGKTTLKTYEQKCQAALDHNIAIWDVLKTCTRESSLDSDIVESSIEPNDIISFTHAHAEIKSIYFNGAKSQQTFNRYIKAYFDEMHPQIKQVKLPSTSPANAGVSKADKMAIWQQIKHDLNC